MGERIRVLFVSHDAELYGAQKCLLDLLEGLDRGRIEPIMVAPRAGPLTEKVTALGIPVHVKPIRHWMRSVAGARSRADLTLRVLRGLKTRVWSIAALIQRHAVDVVYTNTGTVLEGALAARITHKPHLWYLTEIVRGNDEIQSLLPQWLVNRVVAALADVRIVISRFNQRAYGIRRLGPRDKLIYPGVDIHRFHPADQKEPDVHSVVTLPANGKRAIVAGAIHPRKGMDTLLAAAKLLRDRRPDLHFLVMGASQTRFAVDFKRQVADAGLSTRFHFLGWVPDHAPLIARADLLISAARQESFGLTVAEAMASGVPVVATRSGGPQEIIVDRESGLLVPVNDAPRLADAIFEVTSDPALARSLGECGMKRVREHFALQKYVSELQTCILQYATK